MPSRTDQNSVNNMEDFQNYRKIPLTNGKNSDSLTNGNSRLKNRFKKTKHMFLKKLQRLLLFLCFKNKLHDTFLLILMLF